MSQLGHHVVAGRRPQPANRAGDERQVVRERGFAEQGFGHARTENLGGLDDLRAGAQRPGADQDGDALPGIQHLGRAAQIVVLRHDARRRIADGGVHRAMLVGWGGDGLLRLHVVGNDDAGHRPLGQGDAHGAIDRRGGLAPDH